MLLSVLKKESDESGICGFYEGGEELRKKFKKLHEKVERNSRVYA